MAPQSQRKYCKRTAKKSCFIILIITTSFLLLDVHFSPAQEVLHNEQTDKEITRAFHEIYNFRFDSAQQIINHAETNPENSAWYYFASSNINLWKIFGGSLKSKQEPLFNKNLEYLLENCEALHNDKEKQFLLIMYYTYKTRLSMSRKEYIEAFKAIRQYYSLLDPVFKNQDYPPYRLINGLYLYLFDHARENYMLFRPFLLFYKQGDAQKGLEHLEKASENPHMIISTEACYFLMKIYYDMEEDPCQALPYARKLYSKYPGNFIFNYYYHKIKSELHPFYYIDINMEKNRVLKHSCLSTVQQNYFEFLLRFRYP
ncbi:MAG: hypothetical protein R6U19_00260 [Bacteroidales bacterium]